ncbi:hypothetical protein GW17_00042145 [Ensete ventricosum]|nr:hypothetical protein GW17_00042145 [Ensete ventricosum]
MDHLAIIAQELSGGDASNFEVDGVKCNNLDDNDVSDEEIDSEELERRMWKDRIKLKRIKEREKLAAERAASERSKPKHTSDQARRKKMSRAQDGILKYMLKLMEVCNVRGFVYGIIPEKGKPVSGASDNIRAWWKEKVRFDKNGPAAIAKYEDREEPNSSSNEYDVDVLEDVSGSISSKDDEINLQVETQGCAGNITPTSREDRLVENSNQHGLSKDKTTEQPKRKRPRGSAASVDKQMVATQSERMPEETRYAISDMNGAAMTTLAHHRSSVNHEPCMNPNATHQERDSRSQYLVASIPCVNVASENIYIGGQPLPYPGLGNSEPQNATTNDTGGNDGFYSSSGGFGILQDKRQHPMSITNHGIRSDKSIIPVENNLYENVMAQRNASSRTVTGDMDLFLGEPFYGEPDKLVDDSFGALPLDFIGIGSTDLIPDLGDILNDDDLMEYLGT